MRTPWGVSQSTEEIARGITEVSTPGHGGIKLSAARQAQLPAVAGLHNFNKGLTWWEEDCDWVVPFLMFSEEFKVATGDYYATNLDFAHTIAKRCHPEFHAWYVAQEKKA